VGGFIALRDGVGIVKDKGGGLETYTVLGRCADSCPRPIQNASSPLEGSLNLNYAGVNTYVLTEFVFISGTPACYSLLVYWKNSVISGAVAAAPGKSVTPKPSIMSLSVLSCW
jgi:hypothetical protein